ncbi:hypothetical protein BKA66DRAFT_537245 [Pyrenochaeta sp. MPI-SDFR-AT-0127]|nr:hypothetical protein BKA66DRAFT_537245 [Pyrenochaeta sp. MPI-SDFR-AT-0127]
MEIPIERTQTPPPPYLLTPPPTGGFNKRVRFVDTEVTNNTSRHLNKSKEGESLIAFFEDLQEGPDVDLSDISDAETGNSSNDTPPTSLSSSKSATSRGSVLEKHDPFASLAIAIDAPTASTHADLGPFPFLKLPLSARREVYMHLLVIPAIICIRQKYTSFHGEESDFLYAERRELLPGIANALAQITVDGHNVRFSRFAATNINILCVSKEVHAEARTVLYGKNAFEIVKPTNELSPPPDFSVRLFPPGCQRLITKLNICIRSFYDLHWLLSGGYNVIKNHYRSLDKLTLILELISPSKGFGRRWSRRDQEIWKGYINRLHGELANDLFGKERLKSTKMIPACINLRVLFSGENFDRSLCIPNAGAAASDTTAVEQAKRDELRHALVETWEFFKKGGHNSGML